MILAERRRYEKELVAARDRAEASDRLKGFILRNMSHEIRTPITNILGFAEILSERIGDEDVQFTQYIKANGRRLLETVTAILDFSKLATDSFELDPKEIDVRDAATDAVARFVDVAEEKGLSLGLDVPDDEQLAHLDRPAVDRILNHLVGNAIKFTREGGVVIRARSFGDRVELEVQDSGVGISEEFRSELYAPFKQESEGDSRSFEGTGLGLAICRRLVELMGGEIAVESEKGFGTTFKVTFPQRRRRRMPEWKARPAVQVAPAG
jgi:signal transduction histidine kinase